MRFQFLIDPWILPILLPFGATPSNSYAELEGNKLHVKLGYLFDETLDVSKIERAEKAHWSLLQGLGHRIWFGKKMGVLASTRNVVCLSFKEPQLIKALWSFYFETNEFYLSLADPDAFIKALEL